jgi:hypothetical protein
MYGLQQNPLKDSSPKYVNVDNNMLLKLEYENDPNPNPNTRNLKAFAETVDSFKRLTF